MKPPRVPTHTERVLVEFEKRYLLADCEHAIVVDNAGRVLFEKVGGRHSIRFSRHEILLMEDSWLSHTHPAGNSFSPSDIRLMMMGKATQIRVVGRNSLQQIYRHVAWPTAKLAQLTPAEVEDWLTLQLIQRERENARLILQHKLNQYKAEVNLDHEVMKEGALQFGFGYRRRKMQ